MGSAVVGTNQYYKVARLVASWHGSEAEKRLEDWRLHGFAADRKSVV